MFLCLKCGTPLGEIQVGSVFEQICTRCRYKFQVVTGRLAERGSWPVALGRSGPSHSVRFAQAFELHLDLAFGRSEVVTFQLHHRQESVTVRTGDIVAAVYTMREAERDELVQICNYSSGEIFEIARPGLRAQSRAGCLSLIAALIAFTLAGNTSPFPAVAILLAIAVFVVSMLVLKERLEPTHAPPAEADAARAATERLLHQKHALDMQRRSIGADRTEKLELRDRLLALQCKMRDVELPAYEPRIAALDRAVATLDEQIALDDKLLAGYERSIKILEIEHEAGTATERLAEDMSAVIQAKLDELRMLEEQHAELGRQLSANAEVERLLAQPGR